MKAYLKKDGNIVRVKIGFSWTTFFFGWLVAFFRRDYGWAAFMLFISTVLNTTIGFFSWLYLFTLALNSNSNISYSSILPSIIAIFVISIIFGTIYNKQYNKLLMSRGWTPYKEEDRQKFERNGFLFVEEN